jgi:hypothetical protein
MISFVLIELGFPSVAAAAMVTFESIVWMELIYVCEKICSGNPHTTNDAIVIDPIACVEAYIVDSPFVTRQSSHR